MASRDRSIATRIERWFNIHARPLPWRTTPRDPYASLVSEVMAQQTQISRVLDRFPPFIARFPTLRALAEADEHDVLALWSGLGYYRRARNLHAAAREIATRFDGLVPDSVNDLRSLPGIGRYTAGAIASIVFHHPEPIVDGNVARVLLRVEGRDLVGPAAQRFAWSQASKLIAIAPDPAAFNEGLMELGATICTPRSPRCDACPLHRLCIARRKDLQNAIPRPKPPAARSILYCSTVLIRDTRERILLERRPDTGLWAGLWQLPTWERPRSFPTAAILADALGLSLQRPIATRRRELSHRAVRFRLYAASLARGEATRIARARPGSRWVLPADLAALPLSSAQSELLLAAGLYSTPTRRPGQNPGRSTKTEPV
ncbi:MAG: A/G-specific adenine glycosylase [Phycisphaerales bacterium]